MSRLARVLTLALGMASSSAGVAWGVIGGRVISISSAPWNVVVWAQYATHARYAACTGVIIGRQYVLTAGHCVMTSNSSARPRTASAFSIEAGVSNFKRPSSSDHPQWRSVTTVSAMPGYIPPNDASVFNANPAIGDDLAVLRLSKPLDLTGADAQAALLPSANLPQPWHVALVMAGFGEERPVHFYDPTGELREIAKPVARKACSSSGYLCVNSTTAICWGDSGAGIIEPGLRPTVVGILSAGEPHCGPGLDYYAPLTRPAALRFINMAIRSS